MTKENPLLNQGDLPDFEKIQPEHVVPAVREALATAEFGLKKLETLENPTWENFVLPLRALTRRVERVWSVVNHLLGVKNSEPLREAHDTVQNEMVAFQLKIAQSKQLYNAWKNLQKNASHELTTPARVRIVEAQIRDAKLSGISLEGKQRERFNEIQQNLANLSTEFSNQLLDATKAFTLAMEKQSDVEGLPQNWLGMASAAAKANGYPDATAEKGPWLLTLDFPSYYPFLQHAKNRTLREKVYRANVTRANGLGIYEKWNNWPCIDEILTLRAEMAKLLGFKNYAELSLASKMAHSTKEVRSMIEHLAHVAKGVAKKETESLSQFAHETGLKEPFALWDVAYYAERRREKLFDFTDAMLRPYFPLPKVLTGLFRLAEKLFGIKIIKHEAPISFWHTDVSFYDVFDSDGTRLASFYLDPYARSGEKRGGAWMDVCRQREVSKEEKILPVAYLICNGTPPVGTTPSLMTFNEVETLFHEFGHGLQHMLTRVDEYEASGIANVEWDAVELPSQFMENWVYEKNVVDQISGHYETNEKLPEELFKKIVAAKNYMSASQMLRQLYFSLLDLELHENYESKTDVRKIQKKIAEEYTTIHPLEEDAFLCSFGHIFAGGYAAGYYSYKWAEVLSADAFAAFEEAGLENTNATTALGKKYRDTILSLGGSRHPSEVFRDFRGRDATIDALLRHNGLVG
ncbi:MAG: Oligopeptidase A [Turneriella sp.]|nr:Oligopeptidase A [Turneriella sp.]